jgi:hypothetical protein
MELHLRNVSKIYSNGVQALWQTFEEALVAVAEFRTRHRRFGAIAANPINEENAACTT